MVTLVMSADLLLTSKRWQLHSKQERKRAGALVKETHDPKVVSSNPGTVYWMNIFHIYLL